MCSSSLSMAKVAFSLPLKSFLRLCSRRSYAGAAETATAVQLAASREASMTANMKTTHEAAAEKQKQIKESYWMRDPKTGNWMPENHFDDVDAVALREKFLPRKHRHYPC